MQSTSNSMSSLAERMRAKTEQDRQELEALTRQQFSDLSESLRRSSADALSTTEAAIQEELGRLEKSVASCCQTLSWAFGAKWLQVALLSLSLLLGMSLGGWVLMRLAKNKVVSLKEEIEGLEASKSSLEKTIAQLETKTWGLELSENSHGRFVIFPAKTTPITGWTFGKRQAVKVE